MILHDAHFAATEEREELALTPAERKLRERARWLAAEGAEEDHIQARAGAEMLICRLRDEWYAVELALLRAVQPARGLAPIPCTPAFVAGILNVRGTVVTVIDLAHRLGLGETPPTEDALVLLTDCAGEGRGVVGLLVHEVLGDSWLPLDDLDHSLSGNPAVRGIAEGGIIVLDIATLLADGRLEVIEEW
jgi:purine-binding chemotaxis protein CheW